MPKSTGEAVAMADEQMSGMAADREQEIGDNVPTAREPLKPASLNSLASVVDEAVQALSMGQMESRDFAEVTGPTDRVPVDLAKVIMALGAFVSAGAPPEIQAYEFDPLEMMQSNQGLDEMQSIIGSMGRDKALLKAMGKPKVTEPETPEEDVAENNIEEV